MEAGGGGGAAVYVVRMRGDLGAWWSGVVCLGSGLWCNVGVCWEGDVYYTIFVEFRETRKHGIVRRE